jgi:hypothetical protein
MTLTFFWLIENQHLISRRQGCCLRRIVKLFLSLCANNADLAHQSALLSLKLNKINDQIVRERKYSLTKDVFITLHWQKSFSRLLNLNDPDYVELSSIISDDKCKLLENLIVVEIR